MRIFLRKCVYVLYVSLIFGAFQNCAPVHGPVTELESNFNGLSEEEVAQKFATTLQPVLTTNCGSCHGVNQDPRFAVADPLQAVNTIMLFRLANLEAPENSRFVSQVMSGHQSFQPALAAQIQSAIEAWSESMSENPPPADITNPSIMITAPSGGASIIGEVTLSAIATDDTGVLGVQFLLDGVPVDREITSEPFETVLFDVPVGTHTLIARARDAAGNIGMSSAVEFSVTVFVPDTTAPASAITAPANGATISAPVTVNATATDSVGVVGVQLYVDGAPTGGEDLSAPYSFALNPAGLAAGPHVLTVRARDAAGNIGTSAARNITYTPPDVEAPMATITSPSAGTDVSVQINVTAEATDNTGVLGVRLYVDGVALGNEDLTAPYSFLLNPAGLTVGAHALTVRARDAAGNLGTSGTVNITVSRPDLTAPAVAITAPADGASVSGTVNVTADASDNAGVAGVQLYVDGNAYGDEDLAAPYLVALNSTGLTNGSHALTMRARDAAGNMTTSAARTITVNNVVSDTTVPSASITAPASGSTVMGIVTVSASASDNAGIVEVRLYVDGVATGTEDTTSPYAFTLNTSALTNGSHALTVRARDAAGNTTTSSARSINVNNPDVAAPVTSITSPSNNSTLGGSVNVLANATDNTGIAGVRLYVDGNAYGTEDTSAPYSIALNTTTLTNGAHELTVRARDAAGNMANSNAVNVTVNNPVADTAAPSVNITAPAAGAVTGTVSISASASDNTGVVGVTFLVNNVPVGGEDTSSPYSVAWVTTGLAAGNYSLTARVRDAAGNTQTSAAVTVTIAAAVNPQATYTWISQNILVPRCISCHAAGDAEKGVRYDSYTETIRTARAGNLSGSKLYTTTKSGSMPDSGSRLTAAQVQNIADWIAAGAPNN